MVLLILYLPSFLNPHHCRHSFSDTLPRVSVIHLKFTVQWSSDAERALSGMFHAHPEESLWFVFKTLEANFENVPHFFFSKAGSWHSGPFLSASRILWVALPHHRADPPLPLYKLPDSFLTVTLTVKFAFSHFHSNSDQGIDSFTL